MRAAFISDLHIGSAGFHGGIQRKLTQYSEPFAAEFIEKLNSREYEFAVQLGDLIEDADEETDRRNLHRGVEILQHSSVPLYHVAGNHDTGHLTAPELGRIFGLPSLYYSFQAGDCLGIVLHSVLAYPGEARTIIPSAQLAWLQDELQIAPGPVIVFVHHSLADQDLDGNPWFEGRPEGALIENRQEVRRMLAASGKVAAVINGHVHWNRIDHHDDIPYITIQSAIENFTDDGTPAHAWGEISLTDGRLKIDVFGNDRISFRYDSR